MMNWHEYFSYKDGVLYWVIDGGRGFTRYYPGDKAGSVRFDGYCYISINYKKHGRHRVVWEMFNGEIPKGMQIDHINGVPGDDRIENLRVVNNRDNHKNMKLNSKNKSGVHGVYMNNKGKWIARVSFRLEKGGKQKVKYLYHGDCYETAVKLRLEAEKSMGFHENHGRI